ncbi:MAG: hypothetical protein WBB28_24455 [Crinalium sp.]
MSISETENSYFQTFVNLGVSESDAVKVANILYEVDRTRQRTPEEQAFISKIFDQVKDRISSTPDIDEVKDLQNML